MFGISLSKKRTERCEARGGPRVLHYTSSALHSHPEFSKKKGKKQQQLDGKDSHFLKNNKKKKLIDTVASPHK